MTLRKKEIAMLTDMVKNYLAMAQSIKEVAEEENDTREAVRMHMDILVLNGLLEKLSTEHFVEPYHPINLEHELLILKTDMPHMSDTQINATIDCLARHFGMEVTAQKMVEMGVWV